MDKEPIALVGPHASTLHISTGPDKFTGFRIDAVCGFACAQFSSRGRVSELSEADQDLLCTNCVRHWANLKED